MTIASKAAKVARSFVDKAAVAGCGGACGAGPGQACNCNPGSFPPGKIPNNPQAVPMVGRRGGGAYGGSMSPMTEDETFNPPCQPYLDEKADARYMTYVVGEATIAGGATATVQTQPTQGWFDMFYVQILAVDAANPQSRQRVGVGRFSVGDCPGDCRTIDVFSDVFEPNDACCNGRPLRARFGRINNGDQLDVAITNLNTGGSINVQIIAKGYCHRGTCAC